MTRKVDGVPADTMKEKIYSTVIGGIIGDALGVPVEFKARNAGVTDMIGYGTYNMPPGTWSDDTSLTMCLIENLIAGKDENDLMNRFVSYQDKGYWTPYGEMFDIGIATANAISRYKQGVPAVQCGGKTEYDNGNGALMRIVPLVFTLSKEPDFQTRKKEIERIAHVTHGHPRSTLGTIIYVEFLLNMYDQHSPLESLEIALNTCWEQLGSENEYQQEFASYERIFSLSLLEADRDDIRSDGYVVHSLEAALWCFFKSQTYEDAVLEAVNLGNDTDTIAFITGTIAGMYYGMKNIPEKWVNALVSQDKIIDLCDRFYGYCVEKAK
ncbi:ADP-ribosylglycohydrolase family protein [Bacillus sp. FJAT-27986]|uniref:ADP-ribosylglycohydrolase family protein n=1 Tax=Bacillus sp. FJAT-27986 TaxID=1743146 RepID=UPI00080AC900|nr:ADP-ribosylglycohydrolase family protein [Bacillus sp. FJAT-27986]OCA86224.1 ADP-ribosylglycohydrolase [Bacillus sp. FJAT-27986]